MTDRLKKIIEGYNPEASLFGDRMIMEPFPVALIGYIEELEKEIKELKDKIGVTIPVGGSVNVTISHESND